jgi:hypothetical protein
VRTSRERCPEPRVDAKFFYEAPPISGFLELEEFSRIVRRRPGQQHRLYSIGEHDV